MAADTCAVMVAKEAALDAEVAVAAQARSALEAREAAVQAKEAALKTMGEPIAACCAIAESYMLE